MFFKLHWFQNAFAHNYHTGIASKHRDKNIPRSLANGEMVIDLTEGAIIFINI